MDDREYEAAYKRACEKLGFTVNNVPKLGGSDKEDDTKPRIFEGIPDDEAVAFVRKMLETHSPELVEKLGSLWK